MRKNEISYPRNYYVSIPILEGFDAGSKAFIDCEIIFQNLSFKPIQISIFDMRERISESHKEQSRIKRIFRKTKYLLRLARFIMHGLLTRKYSCSNVVYQTLDPNFDLLASIALKKMFRHGKRVIVVHDLESLRIRGRSYFLKEKITLRCFTHAILHSKEMENFVKEKLKFKGETYVLGFFDYLISSETIQNLNEIPYPKGEKFVVVFAGNLSKEKAGFLYKLLQKENSPSNYRLVLFGKGFEPGSQMEQVDFVEYAGAFPPNDLPKHIRGHFGLVWDGDEVNGIGGKCGEYLRYNSPHKASLYIVCGLPIISWSGAAIYEYIKEYDIGFGIESLEELDERLKTISEDEYMRWRRNVMNLSKKLSRGENLASILRKILTAQE